MAYALAHVCIHVCIKDRFIRLAPGGVDQTDEHQGAIANIANVLTGVGRNVHCIPRFYQAGFAVNVHFTLAGQNVVDL